MMVMSMMIMLMLMMVMMVMVMLIMLMMMLVLMVTVMMVTLTCATFCLQVGKRTSRGGGRVALPLTTWKGARWCRQSLGGGGGGRSGLSLAIALVKRSTTGNVCLMEWCWWDEYSGR